MHVQPTPYDTLGAYSLKQLGSRDLDQPRSEYVADVLRRVLDEMDDSFSTSRMFSPFGLVVNYILYNRQMRAVFTRTSNNHALTDSNRQYIREVAQRVTELVRECDSTEMLDTPIASLVNYILVNRAIKTQVVENPGG